MKKIILLLLILFPLTVNAKNESTLSINCDKSSFKEFEEFTCRSSINSTVNFNKVTFEFELTNGVAIDRVRSNYSAIWNLEINDNIVTATTKNNKLVSGLQEYGIFLFSTMEFGNQKIIIKNIALTNTIDNKTYEISTIEKELKVLSSENRLKSISVDNEEIIDFTPDTYVYHIYVAKNAEKVNINATSIDEDSIINGIGEITLDTNAKTTIVTISAKSESEVTRNYLIYLEREQTLDANISLSALELKDNKKNDINFKFKPGIFEYTIEVGANVTGVNVNAILGNADLSLVKNFGNRTVNIVDGDNTILIKVSDKEGAIQTYIINVTKLLSNKSANCFLKSLDVDGYSIKFNKRVKVYNLLIKKSSKKLDISALAEDKKAYVSIVGNEKLETGSNIKIIVKAENESKMIYQIQVSVQETNFQFIVIGTLAFLTIFSILVKKRLSKKSKIMESKLQTINIEKLAEKEASTAILEDKNNPQEAVKKDKVQNNQKKTKESTKPAPVKTIPKNNKVTSVKPKLHNLSQNQNQSKNNPVKATTEKSISIKILEDKNKSKEAVKKDKVQNNQNNIKETPVKTISNNNKASSVKQKSQNMKQNQNKNNNNNNRDDATAKTTAKTATRKQSSSKQAPTKHNVVTNKKTAINKQANTSAKTKTKKAVKK